jgi:hypothetical protein
MPLLHASEVVASVYAWALTSPGIQRELIDRFFEYLAQKGKKHRRETQADPE